MNKVDNAVIKFQIDFERYKNGQANEIISLLDKSNSEISKYIRRTDGVYTKARYKEISKKLKDISQSLKNKVDENIDIDGIIDYELRKEKKLLELAKPYIKKTKGGEINFLYPSREQIKTSALFKPIDTKYGMTYESYLDGIENGLYNVWDSAIRTGYLTGQTTNQIVHNVLGSGKGKVAQLINAGTINTLRNSIYANTRTALQSFATETRNRVYEENEKYFGGEDDYKYEYLATLDNRTCIVCGSCDGKLFKSLKDAPTVPQHRGCRCIIIPYFDIEGDTRATSKGQREKLNFEDWLKEQDEETQKDVLGKTRYNLFNLGVPIEQFTDNGNVLTLDQLNKRLGIKNIELLASAKPNFIVSTESDFSDLNEKFREIGITMKDGVKGEDINLVAEVYNSLKDINPELFYFRTIGVAELPINTLMQTIDGDILALNKKHFSSLEQLQNYFKTVTNMPKNFTLHSLIMHEEAHSIEYQLCKYFVKDKNDFSSAYESGEVARQVLKKSKEMLKLTDKEYLSVIKNISNLAENVSNPSEVLAECFNYCDCNKNGENKLAFTVRNVTLQLVQSMRKGDKLWLDSL